MRRFAAIMLMLSAGGLGVLLSSGAAQSPDTSAAPSATGEGGDVVPAQASGQPPAASGQQPSTPMMPPGTPMMPPGTSPQAPIPPAVAQADTGGAAGQVPSAANLFGGVASPPPPSQANLAQTPTANSVGGQEAIGRATTDVGDLLSRTLSVTGVEVQHRSPIVTDPHVRGYHMPEVNTTVDGGYWQPARLDLDTVLSKIDSSMIQNAVVVKGPYSVRYGPGFAFIDVRTFDSPRYDIFENHGVSTTTFKSNGHVVLDRQEIWGGDTNWGYRLGYSIDVGNDYETGAGTHIPSSFNSQYVYGGVGFDLSPDSRLEIKGMYVLQQHVELPGLVTDIDRLQTNAFTVRYILDHQEYFDQFASEAWYNYTHFRGSSLNASKWGQIPFLSPNFNVIITDAGLMSTGFREEVTWGHIKGPQLTAGIDLRYLSQRLNEFDDGVVQDGLPPDGTFTNFPVPRSHSVNPGLYMDTVLPVTDCLQLKSGARIDVVQTDIDHGAPTVPELTQPPAFSQVGTLGTNRFDRDFVLWSAYLTGEYKLCDSWTLMAGFGAAQRPPSLTELYAQLPFIAAVQEGLSFVRGDPNLRPERLWQADLGFKVNYDWLRMGVNGFAGWVNDYITFDRTSGPGSTIVGLNYVNTDLASIWGGEIYGELDLCDFATPFITISYVEARDETRNDRVANALGFVTAKEALPGIPPMDTRAGIRFHEPSRTPHWGIEFTARIVDAQDLVASSLGELATPHFTVYDLRSYWQCTEALTLTAGIENIGNKFYREHLDLRTGLGVFQPGRNYYFGMEWRR